MDRRTRFEPLIHGGGQQRGHRSGTEDAAGAVGMATALESAARADVVEWRRRRDDFIAEVQETVPGARLTGSENQRLPGHASFLFAGRSGESLLLDLQQRGCGVLLARPARLGVVSPALCSVPWDSRRMKRRLRSVSPSVLMCPQRTSGAQWRPSAHKRCDSLELAIRSFRSSGILAVPGSLGRPGSGRGSRPHSHSRQPSAAAPHHLCRGG